MANPRQKLKARSRVSKVRQKPKSKKKIFNNPIIAANWDKKQTLTQNYERLGLTTRVNKISGGRERKLKDIERDMQAAEDGQMKEDKLTILGRSGRPEKHLEIREAKIERDPTTGKILQVLEEDEEVVRRRMNPLNDQLNDLDSESEGEGSFNQHGRLQKDGVWAIDGKTEVVRELQDEASRPAIKHKRRQTEGEKAFIEELVRKYGDDVSKMARDMKINYMQRSEGDLRQRIKRWREEGGSVG